MEEISASIEFDKRLYVQDIRARRRNARMLAEQGIISEVRCGGIRRGLIRCKPRSRRTFTFSRALRDIHMNVEARLRELVGEAAGRLHTARSRNDQVGPTFGFM